MPITSPTPSTTTTTSSSTPTPCLSSGLACMACAALCFSLMAFMVKLLRFGAFEVVLVRGAGCLVLTVATLGVMNRKSGAPFWGSPHARPLLVARGTIGFLALTTYVAAIRRLPLADAVVISFLNPAFTAILAKVMLGEPFGVWEAGGVSCSLIGVALVAQPSFLFSRTSSTPTSSHAFGSLLALLSAIFTALAYVTVRLLRRVSPNDSAVVLTLYFHLASTLGGGGALLVGMQQVVVPDAGQTMLMVGIVVFSFAGQILLNMAFQRESAARASAMNYLQVVFAHALGLAFLHEQPTVLALVGTVLIAAGVMAIALRPKLSTLIDERQQSQQHVHDSEMTTSNKPLRYEPLTTVDESVSAIEGGKRSSSQTLLAH